MDDCLYGPTHAWHDASSLLRCIHSSEARPPLSLSPGASSRLDKHTRTLQIYIPHEAKRDIKHGAMEENSKIPSAAGLACRARCPDNASDAHTGS